MSMKKSVLTWGLITGAVSIALMMGSMAVSARLGPDRAMVLGYTALVASALIIFFGVRSYRDNAAGGRITFGQGFKVGFLIALVAALCYVVTWEIIYFGFRPQFVEQCMSRWMEQQQASGESPEKMAEMKAMLENPLLNAGMTFLEPFPVGLLASLVSAGILRTKRRPA